jgi:predicted RNA-binding protein with PUA domain
MSAENGEGLPVLTNALGRAIAKAALAKHLESCEVCTDDHRCKVAGLHERALTRVFPPGETQPQRDKEIDPMDEPADEGINTEHTNDR